MGAEARGADAPTPTTSSSQLSKLRSPPHATVSVHRVLQLQLRDGLLRRSRRGLGRAAPRLGPSSLPLTPPCSCARTAPQKPVSRANSRDPPHLDRGCAHGVDLGVFGELVAVVVVDLRVPDACGRSVGGVLELSW